METATVLGIGALGKAVVDALISRNITTKVLVRDLEKFKQLYVGEELPGRVGAVTGDLDSNQSLALALEDADTVFACFDTRYSYWSKNMPRWISRVGDLAAALQARIIFPGNTLNFGRVSPNERLLEEHPQNAHTEGGQLRIAIEQRLIRSALEGASLTILRFPDIYGPAVLQGLIYNLFKSAKENLATSWLGNPATNHDFLYSKDAGEAMVRAAMEPRAADTSLNYPGPQPMSSDEFISLVYERYGSDINPNLEIGGSLFSKLKNLVNKERKELIYLFEETLLLDGGKYQSIVGAPKLTNHITAVKETVEWYRSWFKT
ncbi:MAG: NmrA family NAD(P)-binding protein [Candidatus Heimdallarchaeota archaeon]|nr:NmrA family NAD(P)-binding protein [Candidatus Heimdallarchaeota archaeon]